MRPSLVTLAAIAVTIPLTQVVACKRAPPPGSGNVELAPNSAPTGESWATATVVAYPGGDALVADARSCNVSRVDGKVGVRWQRTITPCDGRLATAIAADSTAFVRSASSLVAISPEGAERWHLAVGSETVPRAIFAPATTLDSQVVVAATIHGVVAYKNDGEESWRFRVGDDEQLLSPPTAGLGEGAFVLTSRALYLVTSDGSVRWRRDVTTPPLKP